MSHSILPGAGFGTFDAIVLRAGSRYEGAVGAEGRNTLVVAVVEGLERILEMNLRFCAIAGKIDLGKRGKRDISIVAGVCVQYIRSG